MKTNRNLERACLWYKTTMIPKGTKVEPATNIPEDGSFWVEPWDGINEDENGWLEVYGFLVASEDVEEE